MANFLVRVRRDYSDIAGLALDLSPADVIASGANMVRWPNRAPRRKAGGNGWRFGDAFPAAGAAPVASGGGGVTMALASRMNVAFQTGITGAQADLSVAFETDNETVGAANQMILTSVDGSFGIKRVHATANSAIVHNGTTEVTSDPPATGSSLFVAPDVAADFIWSRNGVTYYQDAFTAVDLTDGLIIGHNGLVQSMTGDLRSLRVWDRRLSPLETGFAFATLQDPSMFAKYAVVSLQPWLDKTSNPLLRQHNRLNPNVGNDHRYIRVRGEFPVYAQLACEIEGDVLYDTDLGGELFSMIAIEQPVGSPTVGIEQDTGLSAVFDLEFGAEGHYTLQFSRPNGGSKIVHLDVEEGS